MPAAYKVHIEDDEASDPIVLDQSRIDLLLDLGLSLEPGLENSWNTEHPVLGHLVTEPDGSPVIHHGIVMEDERACFLLSVAINHALELALAK